MNINQFSDLHEDEFLENHATLKESEDLDSEVQSRSLFLSPLRERYQDRYHDELDHLF